MRRYATVVLAAVLALSPASPGCGGGEVSSPGYDPDPVRIAHYLRPEPYPRLVLEVDYVPGLEPSEDVRAELVAGLETLVDKPAGVEVRLDQALAPRGPDFAWTTEALEALARERFDLPVAADAIKIHVLFVDGYDGRDTGAGQALGLSWGSRTVVLYKESLLDVCQVDAGEELRRKGLLERACAETERVIWTHELGHVLGLVNLGLPMIESHEDPDHPHHDHDPDCVMHWSFNRRDAFADVRMHVVDEEEGPALDFDAACLADLAAVREGGAGGVGP